jgi:hypothetical protein
MTRFFITVGNLRSSYRGAPSLTRGRVYNLLVQFAVTLQSRSLRTHDILLSHLRLPNLEGQDPVFISPWSRVAILKPETYSINTNSVRTSQEAHHVTATKTYRLMLFREPVAFYCENHMEHTDTLCGQNTEFHLCRSGGTYSDHKFLKN